MEPVTNALAITTAVITAASQWFSDGYQASTHGDADAVLTNMTHVITSNDLAEIKLGQISRFWLAQAMLQKGLPSAAATEYKTLLESYPPKPLYDAAVAAYEKTSGKRWTRPRLDTPVGCWYAFVDALQSNDVERALSVCIGEVHEDLSKILVKDGCAEILEEIGPMKPGDPVFSADRRMALLTFEDEESGRSEGLVFRYFDTGWRLFGEYNRHVEHQFEMATALPNVPDWAADRTRLKSYESLLMRLVEKGAPLPRNRSELEKRLGGDTENETGANRLRSQVTGKPFEVSFPQSDNEAAAPWIFLAAPTNSCRWGLIDGDVQLLGEEAFQKLATEKRVVVPLPRQAPSRVEIDKDAVGKWIAELGASSYEERHKAFLELKKLGAAVRPYLKEAEKGKDPEVVFLVRELLEELP